MFDKTVVSFIAGNHGEPRNSGKSFTTFSDNRDIMLGEELAEIFNTSPNSWFFDESDDTWYYVCPHSEEVFSEDKMFQDKYGTDVWEEVEVKNAS
jgi:hypothetical protein